MTFRTIIGTNHGKPHSRVWIEGQRLKDAGFIVGAKYQRTGTPDTGLRLTLDPNGAYKVSGKGEKPIIDITGKIVGQFFPSPTTHVLVTFTPQTITITRS